MVGPKSRGNPRNIGSNRKPDIQEIGINNQETLDIFDLYRERKQRGRGGGRGGRGGGRGEGRVWSRKNGSVSRGREIAPLIHHNISEKITTPESHLKTKFHISGKTIRANYKNDEDQNERKKKQKYEEGIFDDSSEWSKENNIEFYSDKDNESPTKIKDKYNIPKTDQVKQKMIEQRWIKGLDMDQLEESMQIQSTDQQLMENWKMDDLENNLPIEEQQNDTKWEVLKARITEILQEEKDTISFRWEGSIGKLDILSKENPPSFKQGLKKFEPEFKRKGKGGEKPKKGFSLKELHEHNDTIRSFIADDSIQRLPLRPMYRFQRLQIHQIAHCYGLKSQSFGSGLSRSTTLTKTRHTVQLSENDTESLLQALVEDKSGRKEMEVESHKPKIVGEFAPPIKEGNIGNQLLRSMGWDGGGLGVNRDGIQDPILATIKHDRHGLGFS